MPFPTAVQGSAVMTVSYFVRYAGPHRDNGGFVARYRDVHVPLLLDFPAIRSVVLRTPVATDDRFPVAAAGTHLLAEMRFDDRAALQAALRSPARALARQDFARMPHFAGSIAHEALAEEVFRP